MKASLVDFAYKFAPNFDTIEVSLFGYGVGECLAVHVGNNDWILVDSCRQEKTVDPVSLAYLESLNIDIAKNVKLIVATHWHDDHVAGLSRLVDRCTSASLAFSQALTNQEFIQTMCLYSNPKDFILGSMSSGINEMTQSLKILLNRKEQEENYKPSIKTQADLLLLKNDLCQVYAVSPSPQAVIDATQELSKIWQDIQDQANGAVKPRPSRVGLQKPTQNHHAVAIWIKSNNGNVLLGSDLEEHGNSLTGWQAVLNCQIFPDEPSRIYKVAHHGSPNGDFDGKWQKLVAPGDPHAILTSYTSCRTPRPAISDVNRLLGRTSELYATSLPTITKNKYPSAVEKTINSVVKSRVHRGRNAGHIGIRMTAGGRTEVALAGKAQKLVA